MAFASTKQLNLRAFRPSDAERIAALWALPEIQRTGPADVVPGGPKLGDKGVAGAVDGALVFVVIEAKAPLDKDGDGDLFVGMMELARGRIAKNREASFAIALEARWWGRGFGTEASRWLVGYAFEQLGVHRVRLGLLADNERALGLYKSIGFVEEGRKRKSYWQDGKWSDELSMGLLEDEWAASREPK